MNDRDRRSSAGRAKLPACFPEWPVDRVYILYTGKHKLCYGDKQTMRTRIKYLLIDLWQKPVIRIFGTLLFYVFMAHLVAFVFLLPLMVGKCR